MGGRATDAELGKAAPGHPGTGCNPFTWLKVLHMRGYSLSQMAVTIAGALPPSVPVTRRPGRRRVERQLADHPLHPLRVPAEAAAGGGGRTQPMGGAPSPAPCISSHPCPGRRGGGACEAVASPISGCRIRGRSGVWQWRQCSLWRAEWAQQQRRPLSRVRCQQRTCRGCGPRPAAKPLKGPRRDARARVAVTIRTVAAGAVTTTVTAAAAGNPEADRPGVPNPAVGVPQQVHRVLTVLGAPAAHWAASGAARRAACGAEGRHRWVSGRGCEGLRQRA